MTSDHSASTSTEDLDRGDGHWVATVAVAPGDDADVVGAPLWLAGAIGIQERPGHLDAWFERRPPHDLSHDPGGPLDDATWRFEPTVDHLAAWRATSQPITAGNVDIVPRHRVAAHVTPPGRDRIVLDPGQAFGSGHHATTTGCLEVLAELDLEGRAVLDVGTGSGVLAIAAALAGAARVVAVDTDPQAVAVAARNAAENDVLVDTRPGSVGAVDGPFDVVLANLLTHTLVDLAAGLFAATGPGGVLVASGVGRDRSRVVVEAFARAGFHGTEVRPIDDWVVLVASRAD